MPKIDSTSPSTGVELARTEQRDLSPRNLRRMIAVATVSAGLFILLGLVQTTLPSRFLEGNSESTRKTPEPIDKSRIRACECHPDAFDVLSLSEFRQIEAQHFGIFVSCMKKNSSAVKGNCLSRPMKCVEDLWRAAAYICIDQDLARKSPLSRSSAFLGEIIRKSFQCHDDISHYEAVDFFFRTISAYPCLIPEYQPYLEYQSQ